MFYLAKGNPWANQSNTTDMAQAWYNATFIQSGLQIGSVVANPGRKSFYCLQLDHKGQTNSEAYNCSPRTFFDFLIFSYYLQPFKLSVNETSFLHSTDRSFFVCNCLQLLHPRIYLSVRYYLYRRAGIAGFNSQGI